MSKRENFTPFRIGNAVLELVGVPKADRVPILARTKALGNFRTIGEYRALLKVAINEYRRTL